MEFVTYLKKNNLLVLNNDKSYLVFKWTGDECTIVADHGDYEEWVIEG